MEKLRFGCVDSVFSIYHRDLAPFGTSHTEGFFAKLEIHLTLTLLNVTT